MEPDKVQEVIELLASIRTSLSVVVFSLCSIWVTIVLLWSRR